MNYISTDEAAKKWSVTLRHVQRLLAENRIEGAKKFQRSWMIPADATKPCDPLGRSTIKCRRFTKSSLFPAERGFVN